MGKRKLERGHIQSRTNKKRKARTGDSGDGEADRVQGRDDEERQRGNAWDG